MSPLEGERAPSRIRVLFPEGSSLSAREAMAALGPIGYSIDLCDPNPLCLCRFSRFVRKFHRSPSLGKEPLAYLQFLTDLVTSERYDVLLPVHEHAFLFSRVRKTLMRYVGLAVADFGQFERAQSKVSFTKLLDELEIAQPRTRLVTTQKELEAQENFPFYVKGAIGTAGRSVWKVKNRTDLSQVVGNLKSARLFDQPDGILVQKVAPGVLEVAQSVFDHGRLVAIHCYQQTAEGVGGSACARIGVSRPMVRRDAERIGQYLNWHGSLMLDYMFDQEKEESLYIEANPRMGETVNAMLSGANIPDLVVRLSLNESPEPVQSHPGLESNTLLGILLGIADRGGSRSRLWREFADALFGRARYATSVEEFVSPFRDPLSLIPLLAVFAALSLNPRLSTNIATKTVSDYSLTPAAVKLISELDDA